MTKKKIAERIYVSVVTFAGDWRKLLAEVKKLKLKEISLFLTFADQQERARIYSALEKTDVKLIPHVHIRHDFLEEELDYLVQRYRTKAFTIHYSQYNSIKKSRHLKKFFIETNRGPATIKSLKPFEKIGGVCVDLSHLTRFKFLFKKDYQISLKAVEKFKVGCNHISAFDQKKRQTPHYISRLADLDYLKDLDKKFFSRYICFEIGNPIREQLKFKEYVADLLYKKWNKKS